MKKLSKNAIVGYPAGIIAGVAYGLNPLFAVPLMKEGASTGSILFFRYVLAMLLMGAFLLSRKVSFRIGSKQAIILLLLGLLFTASSLFLFESYYYIASGLATTLVFLYPVLVAIIMVFLRVVPSWPVWVAIAVTFSGVILMTQSDSTQTVNPIGVLFSLASAFSYAIFIVIINRSKIIGSLPNTLLTFYALLIGTFVFLGKMLASSDTVTIGIDTLEAWLNLIGLALLPTIVSTTTLAIATRNIGATKASVLGVFEPITAILVGVVVFSEPLTSNMVIGILMAMTAITMMIVITKR